ncbi:hypothetical protein PSTG_05656 [Puccinia striiformis f. sp. tritici PST-78]|uniref:DUF6589 domain-containing protein n=1 Tax=Puccinia striiformis f. sp. tritici PST-78 TaxID=1165861 RepID=A0A0L0VP21_9BASI|nr:hypothetical protein PSTG_05656 [Puccinia striiformis f. sp. tritici PST-78]
MPFLYNLLCSKIEGPRGTSSLDCHADLVEERSDEDDDANSAEELANFDGLVLMKSRGPAMWRTYRVQNMAQTVCAMVAFGRNRRHNGLQLGNTLMFLSGGVTERVSSYLNYIGLCSSRWMAHAALKALGKEADQKLKVRFNLNESPLLAPFLFHMPPASLLQELDPAELSVKALNNALHQASKMTICPSMFTPTLESSEHWEATLKSQITRAILRYLAKPLDGRVNLQKNPLAVHPIAPEYPNVTMLKLMIASDNSAQGVGDVFTGVIQQSGLTPEDNHDTLDNVLPIPGAAHTLWNISQAIFLAHWGNEKCSHDTGAWRTLHALGVTAKKPITKKDFNLMLCHIEKVHEANLLYCVLLVSNRGHISLAQELLAVSSETIVEWVDCTYKRFCSGQAMLADLAESSITHKNLLLRIWDFGTILEAQRAMKDSDYGRLMYMWEKWAIMTQGLRKMPHYSKHPPKLIIQLKYALPDSIAKVVLNTLLISPTGKQGHFMATDQYLEVQNYWLKYFFNHSGIGTNIDRLMDVFSSNISVLQYLLELLKLESGDEVVHQSHKNKISLDLLNNFCRMAESECIGRAPPVGLAPEATTDCYLTGIHKLQQEFTKNGLTALVSRQWRKLIKRTRSACNSITIRS